jgi:membrane protein DedA with SNARE-associated domain
MNNQILLAAAEGAICGVDGVFAQLTGWVVGIMDTLGAAGIAIAILLENLIPVIPSEIILPLAGFSVTQGTMSLPLAIGVSAICSLVGALFVYWIATLIGLERVKKLADKFPLTSAAEVDKADQWFKKYGNLSVLVARVIPVVRVLISVPAGLDRMPLLRFSALSLLGSFVWNSLLLGAGYLMGDNWCEIVRVMEHAQTAVIIGIVLLVAAYIGLHIRKKRKNRQ